MYWRFLFKQLLLPPGGLLLLILLGLLLYWRWPRLAWLSVFCGFAGLWLMSTPWLGSRISSLMAVEAPLAPELWPQLIDDKTAIVVLGAGRTGIDPGWGGDEPSALATERLRMAARIQRASGLPLLVTGGRPRGEQHSEALLARRVLEEDFRVPVRWVEGESNTTWENALYSTPLLYEAGVDRVVLVTHAWHMPRARWSFEQQGLTVISAPFGYLSYGQSLLPDAQSLWRNGQLVNELAGSWLYPLLYARQ